MTGAKKYTRREYLMTSALISGVPTLQVTESVSSTALAHPEWDMDETKTWQEWKETA